MSKATHRIGNFLATTSQAEAVRTTIEACTQAESALTPILEELEDAANAKLIGEGGPQHGSRLACEALRQELIGALSRLRRIAKQPQPEALV